MAKFTLSLYRYSYIFNSIFAILEFQVPCVLNREFYDFICDPFEIFVITETVYSKHFYGTLAQVLCGTRLPQYRTVRGDDQLTIR